VTNAPALFADAPSVSLERQLECVRREIRLRRQVYPNRVFQKRMSQRKADEELAVMQAVEATLAKLMAREDAP
jgi:hypothetical protein